VDGVLIENETIVGYRGQPHLPTPAPTAAGTYVVYVDVFERHRTALEEPHIREVALGGPDTATRTQTVWQVKLLDVSAEAGAGPSCASQFLAWNALTAAPTGRLAAQAEATVTADDPCIVTPGAGYRALENRLYRVEVHEGGARGDASLKWSRDNGTVVAAWLDEDAISATEKSVTVSTMGRDDVLRFVASGWVELTDDDHELQGRPGTLVRVLDAADGVLTLDLTTAIGTETALADYPTNPRVRRWDGVISGPADGVFTALEDGVEVALYDGDYRTGDYWLIPARTATGDVEWPTDAASVPDRLAPHGVRHHFCRLAVMEFVAGTGWSTPSDCRHLFPPVTELRSLFYVSGDGQEATPGPGGTGGVALDHALRVGVANGSAPVAGAAVRFRVVQGTGRVNGQFEITVSTGTDGTASVAWTLGDVGELHAVEATLRDAGGTSVHLPIVFTARYREGAEAVEDGVHVRRITAGALNFENDAPLAVDRLMDGFVIDCDRPIEADAVGRGKPVCFVTLYLPWPAQRDEISFWGVNGPIATQPIRLDDRVDAEENVIRWRPDPLTGDWLSRLFDALSRIPGFERESVLGYLTLKGDYVWDGTGERPLFVDGETFGRLRNDGRTDAVLPSGDGRRGGDLEVWFHLVRSEGQPEISTPPLLSFGVVPTGTVVDLPLTIANPGGAALLVSNVTIAPNVGVFRALFTPFEVPAGSERELTVRFSPDGVDSFDATLSITSNAGTSPTSVRLFGQAQRLVQRGGARLQIVHMVASIRTISIEVDGTVLVRQLTAGTGTPFFDIPVSTGRRSVVVAKNQDGATIATFTRGFAAGSAQILVLCGEDPPALVLLANVSERATTASRFVIRAYNAIPIPHTLTVENRAFELGPCSGEAIGLETTTVALRAVITGSTTRSLAFDLTGRGGRSLTIFMFRSTTVAGFAIDNLGERIVPVQGGSFGLSTGFAGTASGGGLRVGEELAANTSPVSTVSGIGTTIGSRLGELGINSVGALAAVDPTVLSEVLGISMTRSTNFVNEARRLAEPQ
ncbi:MAG: DUF1573 domain-containing protein, partial [Planctomycetes bacterium]|nr:DUF1573 domain-containing protein [Planctomycetota bacterium]